MYGPRIGCGLPPLPRGEIASETVLRLSTIHPPASEVGTVTRRESTVDRSHGEGVTPTLRRRTAHDGALKWTRPSTPRAREIDLGNIPVHLRTALRRALEFEARAPAPRSAEEAEQCEEQLRVIADEFFGALLTPVLQRAVCSAAVGDAASALVRHLPRRMRSDGLETVNVRTSRGTTVPVTTPYYREKHARRAKRRPGLYPALVVLGIYDRCTPKLASDASRAVAMHSSLAEAQAQLRSDGIALDIKTLHGLSLRCAGPAAQQSAACGLLDRVTGKRVVVSLDGGRVRVRRKKRGPARRGATDSSSSSSLYVVHDGRSQTWAPIIDGTLRGGGGRVVRVLGQLAARCSSPRIDASNASSLKLAGARLLSCLGRCALERSRWLNRRRPALELCRG